MENQSIGRATRPILELELETAAGIERNSNPLQTQQSL